MQSMYYIGLDVHKKTISYCAKDGSGLPEVVEDGISGIIVPRDDPESLAHSLDRVLSDTSLRQHLAEGGVARFNTMFSATRMASEYARFLHTGGVLI